MKKIVSLIAVSFVSLALFAQNSPKADSSKTKPVAKPVVKDTVKAK